jgi:hypothetical protein
MCHDLFYVILISAFCLLKCGINKHLFVHDWNTDSSVSFWNICMFCLPVAENEASLHLQNSFPYLIMCHINPVHAFITHLFMIPCNHLILYYAETYWILILNLKSCKDLCWHYNALNKILFIKVFWPTNAHFINIKMLKIHN